MKKSKNIFGGNENLNLLDDDIMAGISNNQLSPYQALALRIIKMSVRDYLYFGLGKNGITSERFLSAYEYLFVVPETCPSTPKEVREKYFRTHYDVADLAEHMCMSTFLSLLKAKRTSVLTANKKQVLLYLSKLRHQEWKTVPNRRDGYRPFQYAAEYGTAIQVLASPDDPAKLARLLCFERRKPLITQPAEGLQYKSLLF